MDSPLPNTNICVFIWPIVAPFVSGFIVTSHLGWRWTQYIAGIMRTLALILSVLFLHKSYAPAISTVKQRDCDSKRRIGLSIRSWERQKLPIVFLMSLYAAFIYGLLYLSLTAFSFIFQGFYKMRPGTVRSLVMILRALSYCHKLEANNVVAIPEWRLPKAMVGWSGYREEVHWIVPIIGGAVTGFGISLVFLQIFNYLIDAYTVLAASALVANVFLRSIFGAVFPLFTHYMFKGIGIQWSLMLLGCVTSLLALVPFVLNYKGVQIRKISKHIRNKIYNLQLFQSLLLLGIVQEHKRSRCDIYLTSQT
ncbi:major facilitator superfamily domain-containing protein [Trichoderma asperelloides]|nr:major facilitator superfamily domain-containing protein [Trichoderma asperelloides]